MAAGASISRNRIRPRSLAPRPAKSSQSARRQGSSCAPVSGGLGPGLSRPAFAAGGRPGDIVHVAYGYGLFTGGLGAHYGAERLGCTVIPVSGGQTERQVRLIQDFKPDIIMVTPSYMLAIGDEFERQGIDPRATGRKLLRQAS